jgi:oligoribonuclease NrnB/cAMP/cGMP phosphodiesterase (DHH superfamily)
MDKVKRTVVVYHDPCLDGMASRYAAWRHFGNKAMYIPGKYEEDITLEKFADRDIVCVDFSYKRDSLVQIARISNSLQVLDHHKTAIPEIEAAIEELQGTEDEGKIVFHYDAERSGVGIVWDVFHPKKPMPRILWHIEDRDLWKFSLPHTREICCYMTSLKGNFKRWVSAIESENLRELVSKGTSIRHKEKRDIQDLMVQAEIIEWEGYVVASITNCPKDYVSEACNALLDKYPYVDFSANKSWNGEGWLWSLRSTDCKKDVGAIAKGKGGGGHRNASGFFVRGYKTNA